MKHAWLHRNQPEKTMKRYLAWTYKLCRSTLLLLASRPGVVYPWMTSKGKDQAG
jgi:hypothetical protein